MKSAKSIVIVAAVIFAALSLSAPSAEPDKTTPVPVVTRTTSSRMPARPNIVRRIPPVDPHKDSVILLETFMVEVRLSALNSLGIPAISHGDDLVTADHIIKLMKTSDAAVVTAGAKLALAHANKASTESTTRKAIHTDPPNNTKTQYFDVGTSFTAVAEIRQEKVFTELEFEFSDVVKDEKKADAIPQIVERNWTSTICLKPGRPAIVGATQDKNTAVFLIVTANFEQ